jgi:hypothetical protein
MRLACTCIVCTETSIALCDELLFQELQLLNGAVVGPSFPISHIELDGCPSARSQTTHELHGGCVTALHRWVGGGCWCCQCLQCRGHSCSRGDHSDLAVRVCVASEESSGGEAAVGGDFQSFHAGSQFVAPFATVTGALLSALAKVPQLSGNQW